jgi:hypothetical protein
MCFPFCKAKHPGEYGQQSSNQIFMNRINYGIKHQLPEGGNRAFPPVKLFSAKTNIRQDAEDQSAAVTQTEGEPDDRLPETGGVHVRFSTDVGGHW